MSAFAGACKRDDDRGPGFLCHTKQTYGISQSWEDDSFGKASTISTM